MKPIRTLPQRVLTWAHQPVQTATHPARETFRRELGEARRANRDLTNAGAVLTATAALAAVALAAVVQMMLLSKYATMHPTAFANYHPLTPWLSLAGSTLYATALHLKRITYWLPYLPAAMTGLSSLVLVLLIHGRLEPSDLDWFPDAPSWWQGT